MSEQDTKVQLQELVQQDIDLLHKKIIGAKRKSRIPVEDRSFVVKLMELEQQKLAIEAVTKLDEIETDLLEQLIRQINEERKLRIGNTK